MAIRRDPDGLVAQSAARRVQGGAISLPLRAEEPSFSGRPLVAVDSKRRIGRVTADPAVDVVVTDALVPAVTAVELGDFGVELLRV